MKILVLSDSHGSVNHMVQIVDKVRPDHILHLGDCKVDADDLHEMFPDIPMDCVPGNCDFGSFDQPEKLITLGGKRILMMHGHTRNVKYGTMSAEYAAREVDACILVFGHTHRPMVDFDGKLYMMNPGTCSYGSLITYGVITIDGSRYDCSTFRL